MRRIPRPQRAIDPSLPVAALLRHQGPLPSCRRVATPHPLLRTTSASFSTTPICFSIVSGKQDKKKHQQFVRRWQKRLLGDSEPIGAHVDPYDPTSPVRIAPEEQGEEVEELIEYGSEGLGVNFDAVYEEETDGKRLKHMGGPKWTERLEEVNLAKEYEKLTLRTYTPLSKKMADQFEDMTGTMYTLRDDNLAMGQEFEEVTKKPYTSWSFGPTAPVRDLPKIRSNFHQAVVEIYTLKQARKELDVSAAPNRGIYNPPKWIKDVKLQKTSTGEFGLAFPAKRSVDGLLRRMQHVPEYSPQQQAPAEDDLIVEEDEVVVEEPVPQMDPNTPAFKRAAIVKQDPDKKPFDFMSNRPVPRTTPPPPAEPVVESAVQAEEPVVVVEAVGTAETSAADSTRLVDLENAVEKAEKEVASLQSKARDAITAVASEEIIRIDPAKTEARAEAEAEAKWRHVPLIDIDIKFALTKRLNQLTGLYISDPDLTSAHTLGDLYHHFCAAAKPKPKHLFTQLHLLGQQQAQAAKQAAQNTDSSAPAVRSKPNLSTLLKLKNVDIHRKRPNATAERKKSGLQKVIRWELQARKLVPSRVPREEFVERQRQNALMHAERKAVEGTRAAPQFGVPISPNAAALLKERTGRKKKELFNRDAPEGQTGLSMTEIDDMIRRRKIIEVE
ncbi:hypothetical protein CC80DRAFT_494478 [Byssothecium circinans]|uniref:Large ribosomal subunit protein mL50 n=1 Tax=Byssothecium circinans TaxID=147558 RepID=A0A6A5TLM4_9PLEO|nr:hypothetical protein CC80DRAFT_494478 [Byssothecium circinans]